MAKKSKRSAYGTRLLKERVPITAIRESDGKAIADSVQHYFRILKSGNPIEVVVPIESSGHCGLCFRLKQVGIHPRYAIGELSDGGLAIITWQRNSDQKMIQGYDSTKRVRSYFDAWLPPFPFGNGCKPWSKEPEIRALF